MHPPFLFFYIRVRVRMCHTFMYVCMYVCVKYILICVCGACLYVYMFASARTYMCTLGGMHVFKCGACLYMYVCICVCVCVSVRTHAHMCACRGLRFMSRLILHYSFIN